MSQQQRKAPPRSGFSRRAFLKGSGAVAAATAISVGTEEALAQDSKVQGAGYKTIELNVNGKAEKVNVENRTTLMDALRYQLNLTGCKPVTLDGSSGASTVLVDGKPMSASTLLAVACVGKKIQTTESLGGDNPDAVVKSFIKHDAMQCGFCTPGFVMACKSYLAAHPKATEAEIRAGLNGNLCRCGTYANVIQACLDVVKGGSDA